MHRIYSVLLMAVTLLFTTAGCGGDEAPADAGRRDSGVDAATLVDSGTPLDMASPGDAAPADDAGPPDDASIPSDSGTPDAGSPPDSGASGDLGACPLGASAVCGGNVAGGTQSECTVNLVNFVTLCESAGWTWTGDTVCSVGGSPSSPSAFGGDGLCSP